MTATVITSKPTEITMTAPVITSKPTQIAMTAPVITSKPTEIAMTAPVITSKPTQIAMNSPVITSKSTQVAEDRSFLSLADMSEKTKLEKIALLKAEAAKEGIKLSTQEEKIEVGQYNPPYTLPWFRTNELMVELE
ncbi:hypothetical protein HK098_002731 [Nowakowskiella sp. JEL0407]|nr:hypothetical protein HK098_002731 [Nowakowskiella sp. JEL0407]